MFGLGGAMEASFPAAVALSMRVPKVQTEGGQRS